MNVVALRGGLLGSLNGVIEHAPDSGSFEGTRLHS